VKGLWDRGLTYALVVILFWASVATAFKIALQYQNPQSLTLLSTITSFIVLFLFFLFHPSRKELQALSLREWGLFALLGFLNPFLYYQILFIAYDLLPAQMAQVINFTWPVFIVLATLLLGRESFSWAKLFAIGISFFGALVVITKGRWNDMQVESWPGVILAFVSAFVWTLFWIVNKEQRRNPVLALTLTFFFGMVWSLIAAMTFWNVEVHSIYALLGGAYVGLFEMSLTFLLWLSALKLSRQVSVVNNLIYVTPFLSLLVIRLVLKEPIHPATIVGLLIIVSGILLQFYNSRSKE
jgi:drug/metabolite transporter (DMT)-like permease